MKRRREGEGIILVGGFGFYENISVRNVKIYTRVYVTNLFFETLSVQRQLDNARHTPV